jgi:hypothetical protein
VCRSKYVEPSENSGIINSITKLHLVDISTEITVFCVLVTLPKVGFILRKYIKCSEIARSCVLRDMTTFAYIVSRFQENASVRKET